jgi:predicted DNA-binding protein with PD1-like motif
MKGMAHNKQCQMVNKMNMAQGKINDILVMRLQRGDDIMESIKQACQKYDIQNAVIISIIGSLNGASFYDPVINPKVKSFISYADPISLECPVQFLNGSGEIYHRDGELSIHIHATFADSKGNAYGGHLTKEGNRALNTINIFIGVIAGVDMDIEWDDILGEKMFCPKEVKNFHNV